ncbi:hypothetical protein, partial [uncultured Microbacterium sp.]|uniref:hypothetical protein n=1 Tax=uncultured Microbacterium sp. TaxID=191216 RepID=UPI0026344CB7
GGEAQLGRCDLHASDATKHDVRARRPGEASAYIQRMIPVRVPFSGSPVVAARRGSGGLAFSAPVTGQPSIRS